jgi:fatty acid desaturase
MVEVVPSTESRPRARRSWLRIFLVGLVLWVATVLVTFLTGNPNLIPTLVLLGSFLVPVTFVAWAFDRRETGELTPAWSFRCSSPAASSACWRRPCSSRTCCIRRPICSSASG